MSEKGSSFKLVSRGYAAENKKRDTHVLMVSPTEILPDVAGHLNTNTEQLKTKGIDQNKRPYQTTLVRGINIKATWRGENNTLTSPDVRRGERINLYQLGDSDTYYWESAGLDLNLRRLETTTKMWSGNPKNDNRPPSQDTHYMFTVSTHDKHITLSTSQANGEPLGFTIQINTGKGFLVIEDTDGRIITMDKNDDQIMAKNVAGTYVDLKGDTLFGNAVHGKFTFKDFDVHGKGTFHDHITMKSGLKVTGGIDTDGLKNSGHTQTKSLNPDSHKH